MRNPFSPEDRRLVYFVLAAVFLLGGALGIEIVLRQRKAPEQEAQSSGLPAPETAAPSLGLPLPEDAATRRSREFLRLLDAAGKSGPLAGRFAEQFLRDPELRRLWRRFQRDGDLPVFLSSLKSARAFSSLVGRFSREPGFRALAESLANHPLLSQAIAEMLAAKPSRPARRAPRP